MNQNPLADLLDNSSLFALLAEPTKVTVATALTLRSYQLGEVVIRKGTPGDGLYVIANGRARVIDTLADGSEVILTLLAKGEVFGERSLLTGEPTNATIRAASDLTVGFLAKETFAKLIASDPKAANYLRDYVAQRAIHTFLREFSPLSTLTAKQAAAWLPRMHEAPPVAPGDWLFRAGDAADRFYVIVSGRAEVVAAGIDGERVVATLGEGQVCGEQALLGEATRTCGVRALELLKLVALERDDFTALLRENPELEAKVRNVVALYGGLPAGATPIAPARSMPPPSATTAGPSAPPATSPPPPASPKPRRQPSVGGIGRRRFPFIQQYDESDCGAASLAMVCRYYGVTASVTTLRDLANVGQHGASLADIARAAERLGFCTRAIQTNYETLRQLPLPALVHWQGNHYVVVYEVDHAGVRYADPAEGLKRATREEFAQGWTGYVLTLEPTDKLHGIGEEAGGTLRRFVSFVLPFRTMLGEIFLYSLLISVFGLATPIFTQVIVDNVVVHQNISLLNTVLAGILVVSVFSVLSTAFRGYLLMHVTNKLQLVMLSHFFRHLLTLPLRFFATRKVGDVLMRFGETGKIMDLLTGSSVGIALDLIMAAIYIAIMFFYSTTLSAIVLGSVVISAAITVAVTPVYKRLSRKYFDQEAETESHLLEVVSAMPTVKALCAELPLRWKWESLLARSLKTRSQFVMSDLVIDSVAHLLQSLTTILLLWYGAHMVIGNQMTIGQLMAFMSLSGSALAPIARLLGEWNKVQEALISVERLNDIYNAKPEEEGGIGSAIELPRVAGNVKFDNVSFAYGEGDRLVLKNISFEAAAGQTIAIVGRSGSGKTTLANLLLRFYQPTAGRISVDDHDLRQVGVASLRRQIGIVLQENQLFSGSIRDNIAAGVPDPSFVAVVEAATLAGAHDFIMAFPLGYNTPIGERGTGLSGGQKQRIAIARALLGNPKILLFDEATSALDNESERIIQNNLGAITRDRTSFIIAHRLTTVQNADQILVLDQGVIVEQGTHAQLIEAKGLYFHLYRQTLAVS